MISVFECCRVATKCGLSPYDFFPRDITPPVKSVSLIKSNSINVTGKFYHVITAKFVPFAHELIVTSKFTNEGACLSSENKKIMMENRIAVRTIFSAIRFFCLQGLPLRGLDDDERSNLSQLLEARSEDVPEFVATNGYLTTSKMKFWNSWRQQ